jgi:hypothetical protein
MIKIRHVVSNNSPEVTPARQIEIATNDLKRREDLENRLLDQDLTYIFCLAEGTSILLVFGRDSSKSE